MNNFLIKTKLNDLYLCKVKHYNDLRGSFYESYNLKLYNENNINDNFVQDNISFSYKNVLRGLHFQVKNPQSQIVTLIQGKILDVVVDLRKWSKTFGKVEYIEMEDMDINQIYMTPGFAHGYFVLSANAILHYKVNVFYNPNDENGIIWNDPDLNIRWPSKNPIIAEKDLKFSKLKDLPIDLLPHRIAT